MKILRIILGFFGLAAISMGTIAVIKKPKSVYKNQPEEKNPFEGKMVTFVYDEKDSVNADGTRGHLEEIHSEEEVDRFSLTVYELFFKRCLDIICSFFGMLLLSPLFLFVSVAVYLDDPGPVFFTQKRVGKNKQYFRLHKFRSMKMSTPHDVPTHMLENPQNYITRVGKVLRKLSLDELPQIWDIFIGNMSLVGPRPALWNQDLLTAERDRYHANDLMPGLTGWAQINGRDELDIKEKARIDGEYCGNISLKSDIIIIIVTIVNVLKKKGVIEGSTGILTKYIESER